MNFVVIVGVPTIMRFICDNDKSFEMEVDTRHHHHSPFSFAGCHLLCVVSLLCDFSISYDSYDITQSVVRYQLR